MLDRPDPIVTPGSNRLRRNRLAVSDSSDHDDQSEYGSVVESNHGLAQAKSIFTLSVKEKRSSMSIL